jgi:hypothetical protein
VEDVEQDGTPAGCYHALCAQLDQITHLTTLNALSVLAHAVASGGDIKRDIRRSVCTPLPNPAPTKPHSQNTYTMIRHLSGRAVRAHRGDRSCFRQIVEEVKAEVRRLTEGHTAQNEAELDRKVFPVVERHLKTYQATKKRRFHAIGRRRLQLDTATVLDVCTQLECSDEAKHFMARWFPEATRCNGYIVTRPRKSGVSLWGLAGSQRKFNRIYEELIAKHILMTGQVRDRFAHKCRQIVLGPAFDALLNQRKPSDTERR